MEIRSDSNRDSKLEDKKTTRKKSPPKPKIEYKELQLRHEAIYKIKGPVTGRLYVFEGAGAIRNVDSRDVEGLLSKLKGEKCCNGVLGPQPVFRLVE